MKKEGYLLSLMLFIIYSCIVSAQPELGSFDESKAIIAPPPNPEEDSKNAQTCNPNC